MIRRGKALVLQVARRSGLTRVVLGSPWRTARLAILAYHGVALDDEHRWEPRLYLDVATFRRRLQWLRRSRCAILPLGEAVGRLREGTLPPRAVALTFDDGFYDFLALAYPVLQEFGCPATLYLTTWHTGVGYPVPELMLRYLLWKGRASPGAPAGLGTAEGRERAAREMEGNFASSGSPREGWGARLRDLAGGLGIDYDQLLARRLLQIMRPDELRGLDRGLVSVDLHTHRHRAPRDEALFRREVRDNRAALTEIFGPGAAPRHFCYPSGEHYPEHPAWLRAEGVDSATTCEPGLATRRTDPYLLPRLLDGDTVTDHQFAAWISGLSDLLPRGRQSPPVPPLR